MEIFAPVVDREGRLVAHLLDESPSLFEVSPHPVRPRQTYNIQTEK